MGKTAKVFLNENPLLIKQLAAIIKKQFLKEGTGHDWWHIERVWKTARYIAQKEATPTQPINMLVVEGAALLHDIADWKFHKGDETVGPKKAKELLTRLNVDEKNINQITQIISRVSFKGALVDLRPETIEGKIVQDADRLDALGAIGIARTFAYGGAIKKPIYDPNIPYRLHKNFSDYKKNRHSTTINHFYEKLLLLKNRLNTKTAKKIAQSRHKFMELFLKTFFKEWWQFNGREKERFSR